LGSPCAPAITGIARRIEAQRPTAMGHLGNE
jgi:hypothetical protein